MGTVSVLVAMVVIGIAINPPQLSAFGFYTSPLLLEFAAGMVLGELVLSHGRRLAPFAFVGWIIFALGLAALLARPLHATIFAAYERQLPAFMVVFGGLMVESAGRMRRIGWLELIGDASFSIYLTQLISMAAFFFAWRHLTKAHGGAIWTLFCLLDVAAAIACGILCYLIIERPMNHRLRPRHIPSTIAPT